MKSVWLRIEINVNTKEGCMKTKVAFCRGFSGIDFRDSWFNDGSFHKYFGMKFPEIW